MYSYWRDPGGADRAGVAKPHHGLDARQWP